MRARLSSLSATSLFPCPTSGIDDDDGRSRRITRQSVQSSTALTDRLVRCGRGIRTCPAFTYATADSPFFWQFGKWPPPSAGHCLRLPIATPQFGSFEIWPVRELITWLPCRIQQAFCFPQKRALKQVGRGNAETRPERIQAFSRIQAKSWGCLHVGSEYNTEISVQGAQPAGHRHMPGPALGANEKQSAPPRN